MADLLDDLRQRIAVGLQRKSVTSASRWAERYRVMGSPYPGPWTFKWHPWLREMHDSTAERNVGQKSAQMGFTETVLNLSFYNIDVKGKDVLYVLPAKTPDASDFSSGRFDPALELSPHLQRLFTDVKNVGHKRAGAANLYIRGSKSRGGLKSVPVGFLVLDEVEEMPKKNVPLAMERVSGQAEWQAWLVSTPTLADRGINAYYNRSTQEKFCFKCPACNRWTELSFPECLVITADNPVDPRIHESYIQCRECKAKLDHQTKYVWLREGKWVPSHSNRESRGFHVNRLYSSTAIASPGEIARTYLIGLHDPNVATEFWNSLMGMTYEVEGARLSEAEINANIQSFRNGKVRPGSIMTMGVDVGRELHVWIDEWILGNRVGTDWNSYASCRSSCITKVTNFNDLDRLMGEWGIAASVVDRHPETRMALQFANRFFGRVRLCIFGQGITGKNIHVSKDEELTLLVDRTSWLDMSFSRFRRADMIHLPADMSFEAKQHLMTPVRVYKKDKDGNSVGYYDSGDKADHFAMARVYSEIALTQAVSFAENKNIPSPV